MGMADLKKADSLAPNSIEVAYHLALSHYFTGNFKEAAKVYAKCLGAPETKQTGVLKPCGADVSDPGARMGMTDWAYRATRRSGDMKAARQLLEKVPDGLKLESGNEAYYRTLRFYKGALTEQQALEGLKTVYFAGTAYGIANFHLMEGRKEKGCAMLKRVLEDKSGQFGWGYVAAEIDLKRSCR
jgi:tetratricopeptide (TPR) repeat protein